MFESVRVIGIGQVTAITVTTTTTTTTRNPLKCVTVQIFGTTLTNKISIHEEIKSKLKSGNACSAESCVFHFAIQ